MIRYIEPLFYTAAFAMIIAASAIIYNMPFTARSRYYPRLRMLSQIKDNAGKNISALYNEDMEKLLISAGRPLGMTSIKYNAIRIAGLGGWLISITASWLVHGGKYPLNVLYLIIALLAVSHPYPGMPLYRLLSKLTELHLREKNRECFTLYSMVQNEFYTDLEKPLNMYATLNKLKPYFKAIDRALGKAILLWKKNPAEALEAFALEVGTEEAKDLAQILKNVDMSSPQDARDLLDSRYEQFVTKRHEDHRRYRNNIGLIGYVAAFIPVFAVIYNAMVIFNLEKQDLLRFITQR